MVLYDNMYYGVIKLLITKKELSGKINLSIGTIDRLMKNGLPFYKLERAVRFDYQKVEQWLKDGVKSNADRGIDSSDDSK